MTADRPRYPEGHWLRGKDPARVLERYLDQQSKAYSRVKNLFMRELIGDPAGRRVLDFGCGGGLVAVWAARQGAAEVVAVDAEPSILAAARLLAARRTVGDSLRFLRRESLPAPAELGLFDLIVAKDVLEHLQGDHAFLAGAAELLRPGGGLVLATQNAWSLNFLLEGGYRRLVRRDRAWHGWDPTHLRFYSTRRLRRALAGAGLGCAAWRGAFLVPYKAPAPAWSGRSLWRCDPLSRIDLLLGRRTPFCALGWSLMVRAERRASGRRP